MISLMILVIIVLMMASSSQTRDSSATHDRAFDSGIELSSGYSDGDQAMSSSQIPNVTESPPPRDAPVQTTPTSSQNPNFTESPPPRDAPVQTTPTSSQNPNFTESAPPRDEPVQTTPRSSQNPNVPSSSSTTTTATTSPFELRIESLILTFEAALALITSSSQTRDSSATRDRASDSGIELSGGYSDGDRAMTSSQNPNVPESPSAMVRVDAPVQTTPTSSQNPNVPESPPAMMRVDAPVQTTPTSSSSTTTTTTTSLFKLRNKSLILTFEAALALIQIRFQALGNSKSTTLLSSFLVTVVAATTLFAFVATLIGLMLEGVHQAVATVCSYAGLISVVLGFFFMMATFIPERFVWFVWAAGCVLALVFVYSLAKGRYNTSASTSLSV